MALSSKESAWLGSAHPLPASSLGPLLRFDRCRVQLAGLVAFRDQVAARQRSQRVTTYIGVSDARDTPCPRARGTPSRSPRAPLAPPSRPPLAPRLALAPPSRVRHPPPSWLGNCVAPLLPLWPEMELSRSRHPLPSWLGNCVAPLLPLVA